MKNKRNFAVLAALLLLVAVMMTSCSFKDFIVSSSPTENSGTATEESQATDNTETSDSGSTTTEKETYTTRPASTEKRAGIADVVSEISDCVVAINVYGTAYDYFNREYPTEGAGSGVIISQDGYIVTNNHVVTGGDSITVFLQDGTEYSARVIGTDSEGDLAVLKIDASGLCAATIGDSSTLRVGDEAIAIGNPLGELQGTVTRGIISALDREVTIDNVSRNLLQTDAAINPGNSGGGLFDSNGDLIGIVCAKSSSSNVEGLGFVIPIDTAKPIFDDLIDYGYVTGRPTIGLTTVDITDNITAWRNGVEWLGVYVSKITTGGPCANADIQPKDYIHAIDGTEITSTTELNSAVAAKKVGDTIELEIWRGNEQNTVQITLGEENSAAQMS